MRSATRTLLAGTWIVLSVTAVEARERVYYYHNDHLGTPQAMSDAAGEKVWEAEYEPFGKATVNEDPDGDGMPVINNLRFPGQYYDAETGLHYNYHRNYQPETGRYLEPDPIGLEGGINLYAYVSNDPVNATDKFGLWKGPPHRSLTMGAMTIVGTFTSSDIATAVVLNLYVDRLENALNDPDHYMPHSGNAAGGLVVAKMLDEAVRLELLGRHREAIEALGQGSHTLQDRFSHYEQAAGWGAHLAGAKCDNPAMRPDQYSAAMAASVKYFKSFLIRTGRAGFSGY